MNRIVPVTFVAFLFASVGVSAEPANPTEGPVTLSAAQMDGVTAGLHETSLSGPGSVPGSFTPVWIARVGHGEDTAAHAQGGSLVVDNPQDHPHGHPNSR